MFIGHYGVSFAVKRFPPRTSLGTLFFAVQLLDVLFAIFMMAGVEKLRIVPGVQEESVYFVTPLLCVGSRSLRDLRSRSLRQTSLTLIW